MATGFFGRSKEEFAVFLARAIDKALGLTNTPLLICMDEVCNIWDACKLLSSLDNRLLKMELLRSESVLLVPHGIH
ncbi:MAG: hypothetical protein ACUVQ2_03960 [Dissulfurimicrobium sp.]|uniref:hypothetical protein n=1 Tax=Dissulfurimicrobium sp. TaxID=2022436 RepID=UPI00404A2746